MLRRFVAVVLGVSLLCACDKDMPIPESSKYGDGAFIVNQGKFGDGTGTITYFDDDTTIVQDVFQNENASSVVGNVAQSLIEAGDKIFIAVNNAAKVEIVDGDSFVSLGSIPDLAQARYFANPDNGFVYLSAWGADGVSGAIHKIDVQNNTLVNSLSVGGGPEHMVSSFDELYIAKSGGFGTDSLVLVYDINTDEIASSIVAGDNPVGIVKSSQDDIYVLCTGMFDFAEPANSTNGGIYKLVGGEAQLLQEVANGANSLCVDESTGVLYYLTGAGIQSYNPSTSSSAELAGGFFYGLSYDSVNKLLYAADAKDFASNGEVVVYNLSGQEVRRIPAGIIPGYTYLRN